MKPDDEPLSGSRFRQNLICAATTGLLANPNNQGIGAERLVQAPVAFADKVLMQEIRQNGRLR